MLTVQALIALALACILFIAASLVERAQAATDAITEAECVQKQAAHARDAPTSDKCFQWSGAICRRGTVLSGNRGCDARSSASVQVLIALSIVSLAVGIVLFFIPKGHHQHHHGHHAS